LDEEQEIVHEEDHEESLIVEEQRIHQRLKIQNEGKKVELSLDDFGSWKMNSFNAYCRQVLDSQAPVHIPPPKDSLQRSQMTYEGTSYQQSCFATSR
jgi:hypothetical protein